MVLQWLTLIAKQGDCFSHPLGRGRTNSRPGTPAFRGRIVSLGNRCPIRPIRPIRPVCPRSFPPAPLPFSEDMLFHFVGLVGLVGRGGPVGRGGKIIPFIVVNLLYGIGINDYRDELSCHER